MEAMRYAGRLAQHCARTAVALLGQVYGTFHSFRVNPMTREDMLDGNLNKHLRILLGAATPDTYLVSCDVLTFFPQDRNDVHRSTARQAHQEHLHRLRGAILSTVVFGCVKGDEMSRTGFYIEAHPCL